MTELTTRADRLLQQAIELPTPDRRAFLAVACEGDEHLRREVNQLLAAFDWLDDPVTESAGANDLPRFAPPMTAGDIGRLGKYRILLELGRGGMGAVFLAFDGRLQRWIALKLMLPRAAANASAKDRFLREARAAARIDSDHVVTIHEADEIDGVPYIALQHLNGCPLNDYLRENGTLSVAQAVRVARETALGLTAAHALGLVHRDIKPGNLWLEAPNGRVKILDFGLAKPVEGNGFAPHSASGVVVGTPAYMAPEQARGQPLDPRADLFSLGCTVYQLVTGQLPFGRPTLLGTLTAIATEEPVPVEQLNPQVPPELADLIHRLLAKHPDDRSASADEVVAELDRISPPPGPPLRVDARPLPPLSAVSTAVERAGTVITTSGPHDPSPVAEPAVAVATGGRWRPAVLVGAGLLGVLLAVAGVIVIKFTHKDGSVTELRVPDDTKVEVDGKEIKPDPKVGVKDADRAAAEVLTRHPVRLKLRLSSDKVVDVWPGQRLPSDPFAIVEIAFQDGPPLPKGYSTDVFVPAVAELRSLTVIQDWWRTLRLSAADLEKLAGSPAAASLIGVDALTVRLTPDTLAVLKKYPKLTGFGMDAAEVDDDLLFEVKEQFPPLTYLLADNLGKSGKVTAKGWAVVTGFPLRVLSLSNWPTPDRQFCRAVAAMPDLTHLFLYDVGIDDDDAAELAKCKKLTATIFTKSRLSDAGLAHLASLSTLCGTNVSGTKVTEAGVKKMAAALPKCKIESDFGTFLPK